MISPSRLRGLVRSWLPPALHGPLRFLRDRILRRDVRPEWEYLPSGWPTGSTGRGWNDESVLRTQLARWPGWIEAVQEPLVLGRSPEADGSHGLDPGAHHTFLAFGYVLERALRGRDRLSMLDWGGGLGQYAVLARALEPSIVLDYHCRDVPVLVRGGRSVLPGDSFHDTDESALARTYDLVVASGSLQYSVDWQDTLGRLGAAVTRGGYLYVTRVPIVVREPSYVVLQRPHAHGYETEYAGWFFNRGDLLRAARDAGLALTREFLVAERPDVRNAPEAAEYRGFLFAPRARAAF